MGGAEYAHLEEISDGSEPCRPFVGGTHPDEERCGTAVFVGGRHVGCGNLWSYRSLSRKLCWRFEGALAGLGPGAVWTPVSGRPVTRPYHLRVRAGGSDVRQ